MQLNFLEVTSQIGKINHTLGDWRKIITGVAQGSILVPLLFNIFLNGISFFIKDDNLGNYEDDSTLYAWNKSL